jgi:hypothetical protein
MLHKGDKTEPRIPASLAPFFQEYRLEKLDLVQHQALIIERTLAYGIGTMKGKP